LFLNNTDGNIINKITAGAAAAGGGGWLDHSNDVANNNSLTMIIHEPNEGDYEDLDVGELLSRFEAEF